MMTSIWYSYDIELVFCCFVCLSSFDWNEWSLFPNFGGRFSSSINFRCDFVECLTVVRSLWLKTERIVLARNRLFVFLIVLTRHALGPISWANLLLFDASRCISSTARLKRWAILKIWIFEWLNEYEAILPQIDWLICLLTLLNLHWAYLNCFLSSWCSLVSLMIQVGNLPTVFFYFSSFETVSAIAIAVFAVSKTFSLLDSYWCLFVDAMKIWFEHKENICLEFIWSFLRWFKEKF